MCLYVFDLNKTTLWNKGSIHYLKLSYFCYYSRDYNNRKIIVISLFCRCYKLFCTTICWQGGILHLRRFYFEVESDSCCPTSVDSGTSASKG